MIKTTPSGQDLEQQLDNILSFVTQPSDANLPASSKNTDQGTLNKALYYLKNEQGALAAKWMRLAAMATISKEKSQNSTEFFHSTTTRRYTLQTTTPM